MRPLLSVALHDVSVESWPRCERLLRAVQRVAPVRTTLLAVPLWRGQEPDRPYEDWLTARVAEGHEVALHGCTHVDDGVPVGWLDGLRRRVYTAGEGEFAALDEAGASRRLRTGIDWFRANRWPLDGFIAPAWLLSDGTWRALSRMSFRYTCTLTAVTALPEGLHLHSRSLVYSTRARWRRTASIAWAAVVARGERRGPLMRFELHPGDVEHPGVLRSWMGHLEQALKYRAPVTLSQASSVLPALHAGHVLPGRG